MKPTTRLKCFWLLIAVLSGEASAASLQELATPLQIDPDSLSVSGLSSGAYMANQMHVAHSSHIMGAGIIAGGPYRCAEGSYPGNWFDFTGLYAATSICTNLAPGSSFNPAPDVDFSIHETTRLAQAGQIDAPAHLATSHVWLFSGANDRTVPRAVVDSLQAYYQAFMPSAHVRYEKSPQAGHAMVTTDEGNACNLTAPPYINDCDLDAAGALLDHIYGGLQPKVAQVSTSLHRFDQQAFFDGTDASVSLNANGHVYIPASCQRGELCKLHIALHGCQQSEDFVGAAFYTESGYNEWAESNQMVILYPQTRPWTGSLWLDLWRNPKGCWDWWGYSGEDFATQSGKQIQALAAMVNGLLKKPLLPTE